MRALEDGTAGKSEPPFLLYANNGEVLPALLANTAVNANQTI